MVVDARRRVNYGGRIPRESSIKSVHLSNQLSSQHTQQPLEQKAHINMTTPKKKTSESSSEPSSTPSTEDAPPTIETPRQRAMAAKTSAIIAELDYTTTLDAAAFDAVTPRHSSWMRHLEQVMADTKTGIVPTGEDGLPLYVRVGAWSQAGGAQQMIRNFEKSEGKKLPAGGDWDFRKKIVTGANGKNGSELWARVIPVSEEGDG